MFSFKIYRPVKKNVRPIDNIDNNQNHGKIPISKYFRKTINCGCNTSNGEGIVSEVFKDRNCCKPDKEKIIRSGIVNKNTLQTGYNMDYNQYMKKRCNTYEQRNKPKPNCTNCCSTQNVYKRSNRTYATNGAVSSSLHIEANKQTALYYGN